MKSSHAIEKDYGSFYLRKNPAKVYPVEFVVRTLLGTYPGLNIDRSTYQGSRILDLGFGDGRNMPLLHDLGFDVSGVEISDEICQLTSNRMQRLGVPVIVKTGSNAHIPFDDGMFDFVLSCHACYYVGPGESFSDNLDEIARILRPGGRFIFSLLKSDSYLLDGAESLQDGHYRVTRDPYEVRNGSVLRAFASYGDVRDELGRRFSDLALGLCENDYYGIYEKVWIGTGIRNDSE
jgi:SAM-dependent methyltransferase